MAALASAAEIPPGGEGSINTTLTTSRRSGPVTKTVRVETDDPEREVVTLVLKATIVVEAGLEPDYINFEKISVGEVATKVAELVTNAPERVKLTKVEVPADAKGIKARVVKVDGRAAVEVKVQPREVGTLSSAITVHTTSEKTPSFEVMVRARVLGNWEVSTTRIFFSEPDEGAEQRRTITITPRNSTRFKLLKAVVTEGDAQATLSKTKEAYEVEVVLRSAEKRRGTVEIQTNDPAERTISVTYLVRSKTPSRMPTRPIHRPGTLDGARRIDPRKSPE
jgi:hypothetical protein